MATRTRTVLFLGLAGAILWGCSAPDDARDQLLGPQDEGPAIASPFELAWQDDGVASLPVFLGPFPDSNGMALLSQLTPAELGAHAIPGVWAKGMLNDLWGWTSPAGEEYALVTNTGGIAVVRVTDPSNPQFLGKIPSQGEADIGNIWGDPATYGHHAYFVTEIAGSSIVVLDMSGLDGLDAASSPEENLPPEDVFEVSPGGYAGAHNVVINEDSGYAYLAGVHLEPGAANNACGAENPPFFNTLILDLNDDPTDPNVAACLQDVGEHDFHVIQYDGPDEEHLGKEIAFVFDGRDRAGFEVGNPIGGKTLIWDVSDKQDIVELAAFRLPDAGLVFSHNGATTEDQDFLFIGDEIDELVLAGWSFAEFFTEPVDDPTRMPQTGTYVVDIRDLDNPQFHTRYEDGTVGLDHNFVVKGDKLFIASYTSGTRVLHIGRDGDNDVVLSPHAHMDTEPRLQRNTLNIKQEERFSSAFLGQWGIYAFPDSDTIIASDINNGLIVSELDD